MGRCVDKVGAAVVVRGTAIPFAGGMLCVALAINAPMVGAGYLIMRVCGPEGKHHSSEPECHVY